MTLSTLLPMATAARAVRMMALTTLVQNIVNETLPRVELKSSSPLLSIAFSNRRPGGMLSLFEPAASSTTSTTTARPERLLEEPAPSPWHQHVNSAVSQQPIQIQVLSGKEPHFLFHIPAFAPSNLPTQRILLLSHDLLDAKNAAAKQEAGLNIVTTDPVQGLHPPAFVRLLSAASFTPLLLSPTQLQQRPAHEQASQVPQTHDPSLQTSNEHGIALNEIRMLLRAMQERDVKAAAGAPVIIRSEDRVPDHASSSRSSDVQDNKADEKDEERDSETKERSVPSGSTVNSVRKSRKGNKGRKSGTKKSWSTTSPSTTEIQFIPTSTTAASTSVSEITSTASPITRIAADGVIEKADVLVDDEADGEEKEVTAGAADPRIL